MASGDLQPLVSSFLGKKAITSSEFITIFKKYDNDGNGSIDASEIDQFLKDLAKEHGTEYTTDAEFEKFKKMVIGKYDINSDGKISMSELAKILPAEENFLLQFKEGFKLSSVDFIKIWYHYDADRSGFLETAELDGFLRDLLTISGNTDVTPQKIIEYRTVILNLFDANKDHKLELCEMSKILHIEDNFLDKFRRIPSLNKEQFDEIFSYYDKDSNGTIEDAELIALLRDIQERNGMTPTTSELENYRSIILQVCDLDKDGRVDANELKLLFQIDK